MPWAFQIERNYGNYLTTHLLVYVSVAVANAIRFEPEGGGHDATGQVFSTDTYRGIIPVSPVYT